MTEKYVYTDVKSFGQMKKIQSRTADRKNEGGNDGEKTEYVKLTRVAPDRRTGERPEIFQEEATQNNRLKRPYRNAGFHSQPQIQTTQQIQRIPEHDRNKAFQAASSGCIVAITLGIICVILLGISAFFASKYFQNSFNYQNMLDNGTQEYDQNLLDNGTQEHEKSRTPMKNKCFSKDRLNSENYREEYKNKWSFCEEKCYYFSDILKTFEESRKFCSNQGSHLLKIDDEDEQEFIQSLVSYFSWIGLSRKGIVSPWKWEDGSLLENKLNLQNSNINNNNCAYVAANKVAASVCTKRFFFICEKNYA
ncbi:C-type lectin domain family 7 member A-like isoform X1 [Cervus canadensis]|uniref:C-type lectin domain family 7 member A-like isoform X1 n=1 Tax=Cervus canadensis TaxID=1574408 RepID=UPI001CA35D0C|nr:C-type lectin domain family 7 member A-like isoform X1 [Cervus canadensis]